MYWLQLVSLYVHIFSAIVFVGGSYFIWFALIPSLRGSSLPSEAVSQAMILASRRFARISNISLLVLVLTGAYNLSWYYPTPVHGLLRNLIISKVILVGVMILGVYTNNLILGRRISRTASLLRGSSQADDERKRLEALLANLRRVSRSLSLINLGLMAMVVLFAVMMQYPP